MIYRAAGFFRTRFFWLLLAVACALAEKKVSVSEIKFDSAIEQVEWAGVDHKSVLCRTSGGRFYRSVDAGKTWSELTDHLRNLTRSDALLVSNVVVNPADKNLIVVVGKKSSHFASEDAGETWRSLDQTGVIHRFLFHPSRPKWALVSKWTPGCGFGDDAPSTSKSACRHDLFFTSNLGKTFDEVMRGVVQYAWGNSQHNQEDYVYLTAHSKKTFPIRGWSTHVDFYQLKSPSSSPKRLVDQGNKFLISKDFIFVAKVASVEDQTTTLMVSTDGARSFNAAQLPAQLEEKSYTVLDASEGAVILHVNHGHFDDGGIRYGNVYVSDAEGLRFALSLSRNVRSASGECEFDRVAALDGVYIANYRADDHVHTDEEEKDDEEETEIEKRRHRKGGKTEAVVRTVITFDKGGLWSYLKPPRIDSRGQKIDCVYSANPANGCMLHLHGITNFHRFAPFYSVDNAVGLIMGTGNVGEHLRYEEDHVNTYLSRDGGLTWVEAHKGAYIYEFGDHGGLIVMADDSKQTNQVVFSWNEGQNWYDFELGDHPVNVDNIVIEPNSSSVEFLLYGSREGEGVIYHLDFSTLGQPACKGAWAADSVSSDYETWSPSDGRTGDNCLLGHHLTFTRRKQASECYNGVAFERPKESKNCACTERDYQCDFGFTRHIDGSSCVVDENVKFREGCHSSGIFYANAYRIVPGDTCVGGWVPTKVPVQCPKTSPFSHRARFALVSLVGIALAMASLTFLNENERVRDALERMGVQQPFNNAKYAVIGGAARFLDAIDYRQPAKAASPSQDFDVTEFIGSDQNDIEDSDAPPLLDFGFSDPFRKGAEAYSDRRPSGLQTAVESVPRLLPPPPPGPPKREFEML